MLIVNQLERKATSCLMAASASGDREGQYRRFEKLELILVSGTSTMSDRVSPPLEVDPRRRAIEVRVSPRLRGRRLLGFLVQVEGEEPDAERVAAAGNVGEARCKLPPLPHLERDGAVPVVFDTATVVMSGARPGVAGWIVCKTVSKRDPSGINRKRQGSDESDKSARLMTPPPLLVSIGEQIPRRHRPRFRHR